MSLFSQFFSLPSRQSQSNRNRLDTPKVLNRVQVANRGVYKRYIHVLEGKRQRAIAAIGMAKRTGPADLVYTVPCVHVYKL